jgi:MFS family permease
MSNYLSLFRSKTFFKFFASISFIDLAQALADLSILWLVYEQTKQPLLIAFSGLLMQVPSLISAPFLGAVIDRIKAAKAMTIAALTKGLVFLLLAILINDINGLTLTLMAVLLIINSLVSPLISSGSLVIVKEIFSDKNLNSANALSNISFDVFYILGSAFSGILLYSLGGQFTFFFIAFLFGLSILLLQSLHLKNEGESKTLKASQSILAALSYLKREPEFLILIVLTSLWNLLIWGALPIVFPIFTQIILNGDAKTYGLINGSQSLGIIVGSFLVGAIATVSTKHRLIYLFLISQCAFIALFSLQSNFVISYIFLLLAGLTSAPVMIYKSTYFQEKTPEDMRGQIFSLIGMLSAVTYPIGNFLTASIAEMFPKDKIGLILLVFSLIMIGMTLFLLGLSRRKLHRKLDQQ